MKGLILTAAAFAIAAPAAAQVSYVSNNVPAKKGDPKKIVCEVEEQIGSRLGKHKICLTVEQWNDKHNEHREFAEDVQSGTWGRESAVQITADGPAASQIGGLGPQ